jgi:hypothetical protein
MKKMNKMYEAPKAEMIQINVNKSFMQSGNTNGSVITENGEL